MRNFKFKLGHFVGEKEGILDAVDQVNLRKRLDISKTAGESREREVLKREVLVLFGCVL